MALLVMDNNLNAQAVRLALPSIAHGLCHYHYLKEAIKPIYEADRHAKKELKKRLEDYETLNVVLSMKIRIWRLLLKIIARQCVVL
jgi:hypothetical protein